MADNTVQSSGSSEGTENGTITQTEETIDIDDLPVRGDPEQFLIAASYLKEGGSRKVGDLDDEIDEYGRTNLSGNLKIGEILNFIDRTSEGVALTDSGYELAFAAEEGEFYSNLFREGIQSANPYLKLLKGVAADYEEDFDSIVKNSDILQVMRTQFGLREVDESKLKRAISTLFEVLEEAGYGERKQASGDYPIRFSFSGEWTLMSMIEDLTQDSNTQNQTGSTSSEEQTEEEKPLQKDSDGSAEEIQDGLSDEENKEENHPAEKAGLKIDGGREYSPENKVEGSKSTSENYNVDISVSIDLDVNNMDTAEFEQKMEHLSKLLQYTAHDS